MTLSPGMLVHQAAVLQVHPGKCSRCKELTHGILVGPLKEQTHDRRWYVADMASLNTWQIHAHQVGQA